MLEQPFRYKPTDIVSAKDASIMRKVFSGFPQPIQLPSNARNGQLNRVCKIVLAKAEETFSLIESGKDVSWKTICALRARFQTHLSLFYPHDHRRIRDSIAECIKTINDSSDVPPQDLHAETDALEETAVSLPSAPEQVEAFVDRGIEIVYGGEYMAHLIKLAIALAEEEHPVLIMGETGVGKELFARLIHQQSKRRDKPFEAFNCAAIPVGLFESEVFGHTKGSFTDASRDKPGLLELVGEGTLFLDEIGDMEPASQAKLLRVLQDGKFRRVGSTNHKMNFMGRIVAATNSDLADAVQAGKFRRDLYYRINHFSLRIPPLRERAEDIDPQITHFLAKMSREHKRNISIAPDALQMLNSYSFPGNTRELTSLLDQSRVNASIRLGQAEEIVIKTCDLPATFAKRDDKIDPHEMRLQRGYKFSRPPELSSPYDEIDALFRSPKTVSCEVLYQRALSLAGILSTRQVAITLGVNSKTIHRLKKGTNIYANGIAAFKLRAWIYDTLKKHNALPDLQPSSTTQSPNLHPTPAPSE